VIATLGDVAVIRGVIDDVDDSDAIEEVVSEVDGIRVVRDETELAS
jgi:osmotically-inducible protein OsmY